MAKRGSVQTKVQGLDEVLGGGLINGHYMVLGDPGSGYEIFSRQILYNALRQGKSCIYVAVDSTPVRIREEMKYFGWNIEEFEQKERFRFVDCSVYWLGLEESTEKYCVKNLRNTSDVKSAIIMAREEIGADGVGVFETFSTLLNHVGFEKGHALFNFLQTRLEYVNLLGLTMISRGALRREHLISLIDIADGIVEMKTRRSRNTIERRLSIKSYGPEREFTAWLPYEITHEGLKLTGSAKEKIKATLDRF